MEERFLTWADAEDYLGVLCMEERSMATLQKYRCDLGRFFAFLSGRAPDKQLLIAYKTALSTRYAAGSVNTMLAPVNGLLAHCGLHGCRVSLFKIQRRAFCSEAEELTRAEYRRLLAAAGDGKQERLLLIMETLCATGMRVSELPFVTAEAVRLGFAEVQLKGKTRRIFLPGALRSALHAYMEAHTLEEGPVFVTANGAHVDRSNIWRDMKRLCGEARVPREKVYPHNLRHLFARAYYEKQKDIAKLADLLGHSSIETTRIYIASTGSEHQKQIDALGLLL